MNNCQSWSEEEDDMTYRKPGACPKGNCRGYVRWVELG